MQWLKAGDVAVNVDDVSHIFFNDIAKLKATIILRDGGFFPVEGIQAIELAMQVCPSILEDKKMKHARHAWSIHNLIGHPMMQLCAYFKWYKLAFWWHDSTVPKPKGD